MITDWKEAEKNIISYNFNKDGNIFGSRKIDDNYLVSFIPPLLLWDTKNKLPKVNENNIDLYIHIPFCEISCAFCHLNKIKINKKEKIDSIDIYLESLVCEIKNYSDSLFKKNVMSLQFGGGTPSLLSSYQLLNIINTLKNTFNFHPECEIKYEFLPTKYPDKYNKTIEILTSVGQLNAVIDIQTTNSHILNNIGRKSYGYNEYIKTVKYFSQFDGIDITTSIIIGLPWDTRNSFKKTITDILLLDSVVTITAYPLMFKSSDPLYRLLNIKKELFPNTYERDIMEEYLSIILSQNGFVEFPVNFYSKGSFNNIQQIGKYNSNVLLGFGAGAFGYIPTKNSFYQYINEPNIDKYTQLISNNKIPIWKNNYLDNKSEVIRKWLILKLSSLTPFYLSNISIPSSLLCEIKWLQERGYISLDGDLCLLTKKGRRRHSEVMVFLMSHNSLSKTLSFLDHEMLIRTNNYDLFPSYSTAKLKSLLELKYPISGS